MEPLTDHAGLIRSLGGGAAVAEGLADLPDPPKDVTVRAWIARNRIPPEYWPGMIRLGEAANIVVTADWLMETTPPRTRATAEAA